MNTDRYDVRARAAGDPAPQQLRLMLQRLLGEGFKFVARMETREIPIYALVMARAGGPPGPGLRAASWGTPSWVASLR